MIRLPGSAPSDPDRADKHPRSLEPHFVNLQIQDWKVVKSDYQERTMNYDSNNAWDFIVISF